MEHPALEPIQDARSERVARILEGRTKFRHDSGEAQTDFEHRGLMRKLIQLEGDIYDRADQILEESYRRIPE